MAAKNRGTCQCCGRVQMLPKGRLSLHGYTVRWGFFDGTCRGAGELPFEKSKDLIEKFIADSECTIECLKENKEKLLAKPTPQTKAWRSCYVFDSRGRGHYTWELGTVTAAEVPLSGGGSYLRYTWTSDAKLRDYRGNEMVFVETLPSLYDRTTIEQAILSLNTSYVQRVTEPMIKNHQNYILWQRKRIKGWKVKPLLPLINEKEQAKADALKALKAAGAVQRALRYGTDRNLRSWFLDGKYLGHNLPSALKALQKIQKGAN